MGYSDRTTVSELIGKTLKSIVINDAKDEITFECVTGEKYLMYHPQDCCESVSIEEIHGDLESLIGSEIVMAECEESSGTEPVPEYPESWTWTFYKFATIKGYVTLRWLGESNGYYSESVDFERMRD